MLGRHVRACYTRTPTQINASNLLQANHQQQESMYTNTSNTFEINRIHRTPFKWINNNKHAGQTCISLLHKNTNTDKCRKLVTAKPPTTRVSVYEYIEHLSSKSITTSMRGRHVWGCTYINFRNGVIQKARSWTFYIENVLQTKDVCI